MSSFGPGEFSKLIKDYALSIGFDLIGIAQCRSLREHEERLRQWAGSGMSAGLDFLLKNTVQRTDPGLLLSGARSIIVAGMSYFSPIVQGGEGIPVISKYVYGKDYHVVVRERLHLLLEYIVSIDSSVKGLYYVDTGPVLEKAWAKEAGLGWIGRHSLLINREIGSFFFLGTLILDIGLEYDIPYHEDNCNKCRLCVDICPTKAINDNKTIDVRKCISWLTVENKDVIPEELLGKMGNRIIGCDICQDVCPWNKNVKAHNKPEFAISPELYKMTREEWISLSIERYLELFDQSSVGRIKYERLVRNIESILGCKCR